MKLSDRLAQNSCCFWLKGSFHKVQSLSTDTLVTSHPKWITWDSDIHRQADEGNHLINTFTFPLQYDPVDRVLRCHKNRKSLITIFDYNS